MSKVFLRILEVGLPLWLVMALVSACSGISSITKTQKASSNLVVQGQQWGVSSCYIGAVEGGSRFNISDLTDLGINTYRIYGGMSRWEEQDDSSMYGWPTIDAIKANPNVINWSWWDNSMTNPPNGSDYWWVSSSGTRWQGNARTLFSDLKTANMRVVLVLRNRDDANSPSWSPDPPRTDADWNEWWEHVFATVYWLNVRNNYNINDFEVGNESDNASQGWKGSEADYFQFEEYTYNAISYVYKMYLPGKTFHIFAPVTVESSQWPEDALHSVSNYFDNMDVHDYDSNIETYVNQVHQWMDAANATTMPLWLTEWGYYGSALQYNQSSFGITLINNLIRGSQPGDNYVYGSHIFSLYDYGDDPTGLIAANGTRRTDYYALRLAISALQGCRPTYQTVSSSSDLLAITTKDATHGTSVLITNTNTTNSYQINVDVSSLVKSGNGKLWQFDQQHRDSVTQQITLKDGHVTVNIPAMGAMMIQIPA